MSIHCPVFVPSLGNFCYFTREIFFLRIVAIRGRARDIINNTENPLLLMMIAL